MDREHLMVALVVVCITNGIFSPAVAQVAVLWPIWFPTLVLTPSPSSLFYLSSLITATGTLLFSAVPAALYERLAGLEDSTPLSVTIWLAGAIVLTLPALSRVAAVL